jgi:chromosome segregation ATPase
MVEQQQHEIEIVLDMSQQDNMEKQKHIKELETELETSRGNVKELTSELDALRERMVLMEAHKSSFALGEADMRKESKCEESRKNKLKDITIITENEKRIKEICANTLARHSAPLVPITLELGTSRDAFSEELNSRSHAKHRIERIFNSIDSLKQESERAIGSERDACRGLHRDRDMFDKDLFLF